MLNWQRIYNLFKSLLFLTFVLACSSSPVLNYDRSEYELRRDVLAMKNQWFNTQCIGTTDLQCEDLFQKGTQHCLKKTGYPRVKCLYLELHCTLYGGKACWFLNSIQKRRRKMLLLMHELDEWIPTFGSGCKSAYQDLKKMIANDHALQNLDLQTRKLAYEKVEKMKQIYVISQYGSLFRTTLSLLQMALATRLDQDTFDKSHREFIRWNEKLPTFEQRNKWGKLAEYLVQGEE